MIFKIQVDAFIEVYGPKWPYAMFGQLSSFVQLKIPSQETWTRFVVKCHLGIESYGAVDLH